MRSSIEGIIETSIRCLAMVVYCLLPFYLLFLLGVAIWWTGWRNCFHDFIVFLWWTFIGLWYIVIPLVAIVVLDIQMRIRERKKR